MSELKIDLPSWIAEETDPRRRQFRQAVHLVLRAIANSNLSQRMVMKGGILLAIRYKSNRFTTDVDFSTPQKLQEINLSEFIAEISEALHNVSSDNDYGLALAIQSYLINPKKDPNPSFPTCQLSIGYANRSSASEMARLNVNQSPKKVQIDYSFNEWSSDIETGSIDGGSISMYAYHDLIAEKIRSVLQQPIRNRFRFQDIYDIWLLLNSSSFSSEDKSTILYKLQQATKDREVPINQMAMRNEAIIIHSKKEYENIISLVPSPKPSFDDAYLKVSEFFESLPWENLN